MFIIGGAIVQLALSRLGWSHLVSREMVNQVSGLSLDLLIAAAIATLSISALGQNAVPFVLMILALVLVNADWLREWADKHPRWGNIVRGDAPSAIGTPFSPE